MELTEDLYDDLYKEGIRKADGGFLSEKFRLFCRQYYIETRQTPTMVYALWELFKSKFNPCVTNRDDLFENVDVRPFCVVKNKKEKISEFWRYDRKKEEWIEIKDAYFRNTVVKAWVTYIDENGIQWVELNKQKKLRLRKRKA